VSHPLDESFVGSVFTGREIWQEMIGLTSKPSRGANVGQLQFAPSSFFNPLTYRILQNGELLGDIACEKILQRATFTINGTRYSAFGNGLIVGSFHLEASGRRLASAQKPNGFRRVFTLEASGKAYELKPAKAFGANFLLTEGGEQIGSITSQGFFKLTLLAELPDDLSLEIKAFVVWLIMTTRRAGDSGG
jgi:hypothetical protein